MKTRMLAASGIVLVIVAITFVASSGGGRSTSSGAVARVAAREALGPGGSDYVDPPDADDEAKVAPEAVLAQLRSDPAMSEYLRGDDATIRLGRYTNKELLDEGKPFDRRLVYVVSGKGIDCHPTGAVDDEPETLRCDWSVLVDATTGRAIFTQESTPVRD